MDQFLKFLLLSLLPLLLITPPIFVGGGSAIVNENEDPVVFAGNSSSSGSHVGADMRTFRSAAVTADAPQCAQISKNILSRGGTIADATIAGMVCMGAVHPQSSGIGGGFIAVYYDAKRKTSTVLNAREKAPAAASEGMYDGRRQDASNLGGLAVAVPGEVRGYLDLYKKYGGKVPWADLFQPSIEILENGFRVDAHMFKALNVNRQRIKEEQSLREVFVDPNTNEVWQEGDTVRFPTLAKTLSIIAKNGGEQFYDAQSSLAKMIVQDLKGFGSIITQNDLSGYRSKWSASLKVPIYGGYTMHTAPAPASGASIAFVLRILSQYGSKLRRDDVDTLHLTTEAFKHAYGRRMKLGDPDDRKYGSGIRSFEKKLTTDDSYLRQTVQKINVDSTNDDSRSYQDSDQSDEDPYEQKGNGTAHFAIVDALGNAITVTTTVNTYLGARIRSRQTGIIFNDQMDDFTTDSNERRRYPANSISSGKRPMSAACPIVFVDKRGQVRLAVGAAGGIQIVSAVSFVSMNYLWFGRPLNDAIEARRLHHTLEPNQLEIEQGFNSNLINGLHRKGHRLRYPWRVTVVTAVAKTDQGLFATNDPRKPGSVDGY